jgi:hypothetical protein
MSSTPSGISFKDHGVGVIPPLLSNIVSASADTLPTEADIGQLKKEVDDFYAAIRKQANRYQRDLDTLSSRHGTADQARRRDVQKSTAKHEEGKTISLFPCQPSITDSGSESDVPLRKKRKLEDNSRASTPRLFTPKGISLFYAMLKNF